jgi:integrase
MVAMDKSLDRKRTGKRRGAGEGSVFRTKDGRWRGQILLGYRKGGARYKVFEGKSRNAVQQKLTKNLHLQHEGRDIAPESVTVAEFLQRWLDDCVCSRVRLSTLKSYRELIDQHIIPELGQIRLQKLAPWHIQTFLNQQLKSGNLAKEAGLSARSVQYLHGLLKNALDRALRWELVLRNVAKLVDSPRVPHFEVTPLSPDEAIGLLKAAEEDRLAALYSVALAIGLRQGEALALRWADIDLDRGTVIVTATLQRIDGIFQLLEPKTKRSRRTIRLPEIARAALVKHRALQDYEKRFAGDLWKEWGLVFTTLVGTPIDQSNLHRHFAALKIRAGIPPKFRFHDLRHTCASLLIAQGVHPRQIMEILGHSQIALTMNTYGHLFATMQEETAVKMNAILTHCAKTAQCGDPETIN